MRLIRKNKRKLSKSFRRSYSSTDKFRAIYTTESLMQPLLDVSRENSDLFEISILKTFEQTDGYSCALKIVGTFQIPRGVNTGKSITDILKNMGVHESKINQFQDDWVDIEETIRSGLKIQESINRERGVKYVSNESLLYFDAQTPEYDRDTRFREWGDRNSNTNPEEAIEDNKFVIDTDFDIYYKVYIIRPSGHRTVLFSDVPNFALPALVKRMAEWFSLARTL